MRRDRRAGLARRPAGAGQRRGGGAGCGFHASGAWCGNGLSGRAGSRHWDTWATEIGLRLGKSPRSSLTWQRQPPGTSGAVSLPGTAGATVSALAVALLGHWLVGVGGGSVAAVGLAGWLGALIDSLLGAGFQAVYHCLGCRRSPQVARH